MSNVQGHLTYKSKEEMAIETESIPLNHNYLFIK